MLKFFDPNATGQMVFEGGYPYIHWAEPFSIGVIRYKPIYFISDKSSITATMDLKQNPFTGSVLDWNFALYNPGNIDAEMYAIDWNLFCDLHAVATNKVTLEGHKVQMDGVDVYAYQLIIICRSDVEGEFIDVFQIDGKPYRIGAEFYGENESLKINLANQGTEIPDIVVKAIYGSDLYESNIDWVLLNRKFRELMTCHIDIMDNKGSYKSLLNALKWFEYDNLVELMEVWKYDTPDGTKYFERPIKSIMDDTIKDLLFNSAKTTYFSLRHLKRNIVGHNNGEPVYSDTTYEYDSDSNTTIQRIACMWSEDEMRLKMVLLGNFLETYFMPVHADLIRSCVEDITAYTFDLETGSAESYHEMAAPSSSFEFSWGDEADPNNPGGAIPDDPYTTHEIMIGEVHAYAGLTQTDPYGQAFENNGPALLSSRSTFVPMIACHTFDESTPEVSKDATQVRAGMLGQIYNGIGAIETANFSFDEPIVSGTCMSNQWGEFIETTFSNITNPSNSFSIKFLFPSPGDFELHFDFIGKSGKHYTRNINITVTDTLRASIGCYKLCVKPDYIYVQTNPFTEDSEINPTAIDRDMKFDVLEKSDGYEVRSLEFEPAYMRYIPIRKPSGDGPIDAPCLSKVRTIQWVGEGATGRCNRFYNANKNDTYWYQIGSNLDLVNEGIISPAEESAYIRICHKQRHGEPQVIEISDEYRVFDHEVFFPELHMLNPISTRERVDPAYPIVVVPELHIDGKNPQRINYSLLSGEPIWEFYSIGAQRVVEEFDRTVGTPIILNSYNEYIPVGAYRITFNYQFGNIKRTVTVLPDWILAK